MLQEHGGDRAKAGGGVIPKSPADDTAPAVAPGPGLYVVQPRMILEGDWGSSPTSVPGCSSLVDWPARQLAVSFEGDAMLLANRFQVAAFDASSGARRWVYGLGAAQGQTHAWPLVPMRPTVFGQRLCARMLGQDGRPGLVCLELASGKMLWNVHYPGEIVSDPLVVQDVLMALTIETQPDQSLTLSLLTLDPDNGKVLGSKPLADINSEWTTQRACQVTVTGNKLLIAVAGALIYCDPFDEILWVRRSARLPAAYDVTWPRQYYQPPLVDRERAYVCQVGTRSVECIDVQSGQLQWEWALLGVQRVLGLAGDRLLVQTDDGILALSAQTGKVLWSHVAANLLDCCPRAQGNTLLCLRTEPLPGAESCPILEWLDLEDGQTAGCCMLRGLQVKQSSLGPLVAHNGRLWCFAGVFDAQGTFQPKRKFVELVASEGPLLEPATANLWATQVDPVWPLALERSLPGWTLLSGSYDGRSGLLSPKAGMPEVLITRAAETPAHLSRQLALPAGHPQLAIEMGHAPDGASRLAVRVNGVLYRQWSSQPMKNDNDWQNIQIDLSAMAGRNAWILITQERSGGGAAYAYWKSLEVRLENHP
jgi:outer membrane protein assembly factor BamB